MGRKLRASMLGGGLLLASVEATQADTVSIGTWYEFGFGDVDSALVNGSTFVPLVNPATTAAPDPAWTFTLTIPGTLFVTDAFLSGDQFEIFNYGASLGTTSVPMQGSNCGDDLSCALADANFSSGTFPLAPGDYAITGSAILSPFAGGAGAFRVSEVPLPAAAPLFLSMLAGIGFVARTRKKAIA